MLSTSSKKNISIKVLKEAFGVKDDAEGAEYDDLEEANIGKMLETSDKEAEKCKCAICQKIYIDNTELIEHLELCDVEENKKSEESEPFSFPLLCFRLQFTHTCSKKININ